MQRATVMVYRRADSTMMRITSLKPSRLGIRELRVKTDDVRLWTVHNLTMIHPAEDMSILPWNHARYTEKATYR